MKTVPIVEIGGSKILSGGCGLGAGIFVEEKRGGLLSVIENGGFGHVHQELVKPAPIPEMDREVVSPLHLL